MNRLVTFGRGGGGNCNDQLESIKINEQKEDVLSDGCGNRMVDERECVLVEGYFIPKELLPIVGWRKKGQGGDEGELGQRKLLDLIKKYRDFKRKLGPVTDKVLENAMVQLDYLQWEADKLKQNDGGDAKNEIENKTSVQIRNENKKIHSQLRMDVKAKSKMTAVATEENAQGLTQAKFFNCKMNFSVSIDPMCLNDEGNLKEVPFYRIRFSKDRTKLEPCPPDVAKGETSLHFGQLKLHSHLYDVYLESESLSSVLFILGTNRRPKKGTVNISLSLVTSKELETMTENMEISGMTDEGGDCRQGGVGDSQVQANLWESNYGTEPNSQILSNNSSKEGRQEGGSILQRMLAFWRSLLGFSARPKPVPCQSSSVQGLYPASRSSISLLSFISKKPKHPSATLTQ